MSLPQKGQATTRPVAAVATDLDGTLLDANGRVPPRIRAAVGRLLDAGVEVVPATARSPRSVRSLLPRLSMAVCCNGALVIDLQRQVTILETVFDPSVVLGLLDALTESIDGLGFALRSGDSLMASDRFVRLRGGLPGDGRPLGSRTAISGLSVHGIALLANGLSSEQLAVQVGPLLGQEGCVSLSSTSVLDLVPSGTSKAVGLAVVAAAQGWSPADAIAIGDMPNDLDMFNWAGWSVAPCTAHPQVRTAADVVVDEPVGEGIASILERLLEAHPE